MKLIPLPQVPQPAMVHERKDYFTLPQLIDYANAVAEVKLAAAQAQLEAERKELEEAEVLGKYYGVAGRRWWWSGGAWLYPGQKVVVIDAAKGTK